MAKNYFNESFDKKYKKISGIYIIYVSTHTYIGSAKDFYIRMQEHRKCLRRGYGDNKKFTNAYKKYGDSETCWDILELCNVNELLKREEWWINQLNPDLNINRYPTQIPTTALFNKDNGQSKKVYQYDLDGNFINEFESVNEVQRQLGFCNVSVSSAARKTKPASKSAHGYLWSYEKVDKMPKYQNNSKYSKVVNVYIFDIITGIESEFSSIADAARSLFPNEQKFDSLCAIISCSTKRKSFIKYRYLARSENSDYNIPNRTEGVYDIKSNIIYKTIKEAADALNVSVNYIKRKYKNPLDEDFQTLGFRARVKLRESGKLQTDDAVDNPNPSIIEI